MVYHSHVLEHFSKRQGEFFVRECFRVLRPGGLLRLAVPDLEDIARAYLKTLEETRAGTEGAEKRHQWMLVEMLDQLTRTASGGEMLAWWREHPVPQREFVEIRLGEEARSGMESARHFRPAPAGRRPALEPANPEFSGSGELHRWMYDQVSLSGLLESAGFTRITRQTHDASLSAEPSIRELDSDAEGNVRKPDSLFMEAVKPQTPLPVPRVAMFSTSDAGGAAIAALRQHQALRDKGVSSEFYVMRQSFSREAVHVLPVRGHHVASRGETAWHNALPACEYRHGQMIGRFPDRSAGAEHFSFPAQGFSLRDVPGLADFDVLNLHWVAGMCDPALEPEAFAGRPLVWTLHQRGTTLLLPPELVGTHVGSGRAHTTLRDLDLDFRAGTALWGHMGVEWDLTEADESARGRLASIIALHKGLRGLLHSGLTVHADLPDDDALRIEGVVAPDGSDALFEIASLGQLLTWPASPRPLPGLDPARRYRVRLAAPAYPGLGLRAGWMDGGVTLPGSYLSATGLALPVLHPDHLVLVRATAVD